MNNIKVDYICLQGTCGTCITTVLEGDIDHRDTVIGEENYPARVQDILAAFSPYLS